MTVVGIVTFALRFVSLVEIGPVVGIRKPLEIVTRYFPALITLNSIETVQTILSAASASDLDAVVSTVPFTCEI